MAITSLKVCQKDSNVILLDENGKLSLKSPYNTVNDVMKAFYKVQKKIERDIIVSASNADQTRK